MTPTGEGFAGMRTAGIGAVCFHATVGATIGRPLAQSKNERFGSRPYRLHQNPHKP